MTKVLLGILAIALLGVAGAVVMSMHGLPPDFGNAIAADGTLHWHLHDEPGPLGKAPGISATAAHYLPGGGSIAMEAKCDDHTLAIEFEYHVTDGDLTHSAFERQGTDGFVHAFYRADNGELHEFVSGNSHVNVTDVMFTYEMSDAGQHGIFQQPGGMVGAVAMVLNPGLAPQDLRTFLHAQENRFELPLGNGSKEVIVIDPKERRFGELLETCKISLKRFDDDAAKQQATDEAAARAKSAAEDQQKEQDAARQSALVTHMAALSQACTAGDVELRVNGPINLQDASNASNAWVFGGQIVQSVADAGAVTQGKCAVVFMQGSREVTGKLPMGSLDLADSGQAPAAPAN